MIRISHLPLFLLIGISASAAAAPRKDAGEWAIAGAPYRVMLRADGKPGIPEAGWEIRLPDFGAGRTDMRDVVLLDGTGREIGLDGIWHGPGNALLMLAESMPANGAAATLYFGGKSSRQMKSWTAKRSLLLETRRLPAGADITTFGGWQDAWRKSPAVDGAAFVPLVFHGGNPFGEAGHFLSRYTGLIKTGDGGELRFYTLSDDVSYVSVAGRPVLQWQQNQPPPLDPTKVPVAGVRVPKGLATVDYCHAAIDPPGAMVLGWERDGKLGNVPPEAWIHPGRVKSGGVESADGAPVPLGELVADRYLGYGGEWYVNVRAAIPDPGVDWQVQWLWSDGRVDEGADVRRLWMSLEPVTVVLRLRNGTRGIEGRRTLMIPRDLGAASVNNKQELAPFLELLEKEDPSALEESRCKAGFTLAKDFLPQAAAVKWAEAWLKSAKPQGDPWIAAMEMAIRETGKGDPQAALARLSALPGPARAAMGGAADRLELDLRVFGLKDPLVVGLVARLGKGGDQALARMAKIRLGDYHLLNGRSEAARRCFAEAVEDPGEAERKAPVIDRSHSLAIEDLVAAGQLDAARAKLESWERQRPAARLDGDQLLWRARVMFLAGDWHRALQDLETSLKVRPGSPEEIDVLFWQGRTLYELGRKDEARKVWNALAKDYPKHERAEAAKQWAAKS
ncbi:MAG: tetratricopeptide repeat protein [Akkermansiaceae bacterium]|nr:tetratricopeptide repeat protein [Akkermansiaceae bacterium]MCF7731413.1 tetratricopeptide repeat protein [Akkermansiaceae bacterium]